MKTLKLIAQILVVVLVLAVFVAQCKDRMRKIQKERETKVWLEKEMPGRLLKMLQVNCEDDLKKFCSDKNGNEALECLIAHKKEAAPSCAKDLPEPKKVP